MLEHHALLGQALIHGFQDLLRNPVLFQQVAVGEAFSARVIEDRCLLRDPVLEYVVSAGFCEAVAGKAAEAGSVNQHLLHQVIRQREPLRQEVDAQHQLQ